MTAVVENLKLALFRADRTAADPSYHFEDPDNPAEKPLPSDTGELFSLAEKLADDILQCDLDIAEIEKHRREFDELLIRCRIEINARLQPLGMDAKFKGKPSQTIQTFETETEKATA
jgi:hypothetical protein